MIGCNNFNNKNFFRSVIVWIDPKMANYSIDAEKEQY